MCAHDEQLERRKCLFCLDSDDTIHKLLTAAVKAYEALAYIDGKTELEMKAQDLLEEAIEDAKGRKFGHV